MSNFPNNTDDDVSLPQISDNLSELGGAAINALRDAVFNIESNIGINAQGSCNSIAERLGISLEANGNIKPSAIASMGLVVLPIVNSQISSTAAIQESKLSLDYSTSSLNSRLNDMAIDVRTSLDFITDHGFKIEPHIAGSGFRHILSHIDVALNTSGYLKNKLGLFRNNTNSYSLINDINDDLIVHWIKNGIPSSVASGVISGGTLPPTDYAHVASGIYIDTNNFSFVPQTAVDLQQFAEFIDNSNIFIFGTRIQSFYGNGVSRSARASALNDQIHGQLIIPITPATTYLLYSGSTSPVDNIDNGDDIIELLPNNTLITNNTFDAQFNLIKIGDIITVNYPAFTVNHIIKEKKYVVNGNDKRYIIRINGKNLAAASVTAQVNRPLFNINKYGVLAVAQAEHNLTTALPSLILGNPRSAEVLGLGFNPSLIDNSHYNLYLAIYPHGGNPANGVVNLAAIDVTGNQGSTPGTYTLDSIIENINKQFRQTSFNARFIAFSYQGELGIKMTDCIDNVSFSVIDGYVGSDGFYNDTESNSRYPNNILRMGAPDALGFGGSNAGVSSPAYLGAYSSAESAKIPNRIHAPLTRKNFYVNGIERERFEIEPLTQLDGYGESFWAATITAKNVIPGTRTEVVYTVPFDLSNSHLAVGKTITVKGGGNIDSGRFIISGVQFSNCGCEDAFTNITVYDAVHYVGTQQTTAPINTPVSLYFSTGDSVGFNFETATDKLNVAPFRRHFEVYIDQDGYSFTQERARMNILGSQFIVNDVPLYSSIELSYLNLFKVSPKLRGYNFGLVNKINLQLNSYDVNTGEYSGYLCKFDGSSATNKGPVTFGKKGVVTRFYDETNADYIEFILKLDDAVPGFSTIRNIDIQLFPTLFFDDEVMPLGTVQVDDEIKNLSYLRDERQFGNTTEKHLSTSALNYIAAPQKLLSENGVIRGFDIIDVDNFKIYINGGVAIVDGKIIEINQQTISIPNVVELLPPTFTSSLAVVNWFICLNKNSEIELIFSTDYDLTYSGSYGTYDHHRLVKVQNLDTSESYYIQASYLHQILSERKDLLPLYLYKTGSESSGSFDIRRYITNGYQGLQSPLTLGENANFRTIDSLNNFIHELTNNISYSIDKTNNFGNNVYIKSDFNISNVIFDYSTPINFIGDGGKFNTDTNYTIIGNNVNFDKIKFYITTNVGLYLQGNNVNITNSYIEYNYNAAADLSYSTSNLCNIGAGAVFTNTSFGINDSNLGKRVNIKIDSCEFNSSMQDRYAFVNFNLPNAEAYLENIKITNNIIHTLVNSATDDKRAVIAIVSNASDISDYDLVRGPLLVNCDIAHNMCNKNQLILISGQPAFISGSYYITNLIAPINVSISNNIAGAICFLFRQARILNISNTNQINDKSNFVNIANNTCRYIYCGTSQGFINTSGSGFRVFNSIWNPTNISTPSTSIINNTCSWIQIGLKNSSITTFTNTGLLIKDNALNAYDSTFLNDYYSGITPVNSAIIIDQGT